MIAEMLAVNPDGRLQADLVVNRARFLDPPDRFLIEQAIALRVPAHQLAQLQGVSVRSVQRRVRCLVLRLTGLDVQHILRHHQNWPPQIQQVALAVWVRRWTLRHVCEHHHLSLHTVRQRVEAVRGLIEAARQPRPPVRPTRPARPRAAVNKM